MDTTAADLQHPLKGVQGDRVLLKGGPGNRGRSACGPTHVARLKFPRETGLILRCAGKVGNPFQTTQGNRLSRLYAQIREKTEWPKPYDQLC